MGSYVPKLWEIPINVIMKLNCHEFEIHGKFYVLYELNDQLIYRSKGHMQCVGGTFGSGIWSSF